MTGVLVVTGGSRGIGAVTARLAAERGYAIAVNYLGNRKAADGVAEAITKKGGRAIAVQGNVAQETDVIRLFDEAAAKLGPVTGLVNNAGIVAKASRLADVSFASIREVMDVNVVGSFLCAREAVRRMSTVRGGKGGAIVNVSSVTAFLGGAGEHVLYGASKGAIESLTIGLAREVAGEGIRVNAVCPGMIDTEIHASGGQPDRIAKFGHTIPIGRAGKPEEVAEAILWLLSDAARYVSGASLRVSGAR